MPGISLEQKIGKFNAKYDVKLDPHAIEEEARIDAVFEEYRFDKKDKQVTQATTYWKALTKTLTDSLNAKTKINKNADYDLSDLNIVSFIREFEDIMQQSNKQSKTPRERKPFEGMNFDKMIEKIKAGTSAYDKPLYSIWANKVVDNKISYEDLKKVTDESVQNIEKAEKNKYSTVSREDLSNVVYAHEAMFRVCQSRGFWWKVFHLYQNYVENKYLESLSMRVSQYIEKNYPINDISDTMPDSMMKKVYTNTEYTIRYERDKKIKEKIEKSQKQEEEKRREISAVAETLQKSIDDNSFKGKITDEIVKSLPKCKWSKNIQKNLVSSIATNALIQEAQGANKLFDLSVADGVNPETRMEYNVAAVFRKAYGLTEALGYIEIKDQLLAAQVITDVLIKNVSPAALEPEKYTKFANGYALNKPALIEDVTGMDGTEFAFKEAQKAYADMNREKVEILALNTVANKDVVAPVDKETNISAPTIHKT